MQDISLYVPTPNWQTLLGDGPKVILDIGANDGGTSAVFQHIFPEARIFAFEPDPRAILNCKRRITLGQIKLQSFELFEGAVSDENGECTFYQSDGVDPNFDWYETGYDLSGSILRPLSDQLEQIPTVVFKNQIRVTTITLDNWISGRDIRTIDLLWMDVQGAEARVLSGAKNALDKVKYVYLECEERETYAGQPKLQELIALLNGFALIQSYPDGNHLFVRRDKNKQSRYE